MPMPTAGFFASVRARRDPRRRAALVSGFGLALGAAVFAGAPAVAAEGATALDPPRQATAPEPFCFCWADGRKIAEGASACIRTTQGRRIASCGRVQNLMSWDVTETPCPES
jgi:hypothetical protein